MRSHPQVPQLMAKEMPVAQGEEGRGVSETPVQRQEVEKKAENKTGLPDRLKEGIEGLSGYDLSGVRVNYNSPKPAQLNAHAYTQGQAIEVAPGQEQHLPHEAWHVVQQMQGGVRKQFEVNGVGVNGDRGLEREADVMGRRAMQMRSKESEDDQPGEGVAVGDAVKGITHGEGLWQNRAGTENHTQWDETQRAVRGILEQQAGRRHERFQGGLKERSIRHETEANKRTSRVNGGSKELRSEKDGDHLLQREKILDNVEIPETENKKKLHNFVYRTKITDDGKTLWDLYDMIWKEVDFKEELTKEFVRMTQYMGVVYRVLDNKTEDADIPAVKENMEQFISLMKTYLGRKSKKETEERENAEKIIALENNQKIRQNRWTKVKNEVLQGAQEHGGVYCKVFSESGENVAEGKAGEGFKLFQEDERGQIIAKDQSDAIATTLAKELNKVGVYRSDKRSRIQCAEIPAAYEALKKGYTLGNLYFATAEKNGEEVRHLARCENCLQWTKPMNPAEDLTKPKLNK
ncbi:MAG: DUF4157 domain-containing protein [Symploca sp. SIO2E9]|nr:DUF4157 domain-containing protein [Symploca sp. SIO2E9]